MRERPILFSTEMVKAILEGRKTQTRRTRGLERVEGVNGMRTVTYPETKETKTFVDASFTTFDVKINSGFLECPYGAVGDLLWVRETWERVPIETASVFSAESKAEHKVQYKASAESSFQKWKPSIHMPKDAARIWLKVAEIKVERLQDISEEDAMAEGVDHVIDKITGYCGYNYEYGGYNIMTTPYHGFRSLWRVINGPNSWQENPWVWAVKFEVLSTTGRAAAYAKLGKKEQS